jgi:hypothetical protein
MHPVYITYPILTNSYTWSFACDPHCSIGVTKAPKWMTQTLKFVCEKAKT